MRDPPERRRWGVAAAPGASHSATSSGLPPTAVVAGRGRLVAHEPERAARRCSSSPVGIDRPLEADVAVGQGAGLVGEQHVDVAEVLDAHQPLDEHLLRRRGAAIRWPGWSTRPPGSSCGVMPTATASENSTASMTGRPERNVDHEDRDAEHAADLAPTAPRSGSGRAGTRSAGWRSPRPTAIRPNWVAAPVATTTASAEPSCTTVPMNRHDDSSASGAPPPPAPGDFSAGTDSPVRIDSSHSRLLARQQPHIGRDDRPDAEVHDVARHQVGHLDAHRLAVARHGDLVADLGVHRLRRPLGPELVDEPETDRSGHDHPDDDASRPSPTNPDSGRRSSNHSNGLETGAEHRPRRSVMRTHRVGAERCRPLPATSSALKPADVLPRSESTSADSIDAASSIVGSPSGAGVNRAIEWTSVVTVSASRTNWQPPPSGDR